MCVFVEMEPVEVIYVSQDDGSGSGISMNPYDNDSVPMLSSGADITDFMNIPTETVGQLYAYYYSNTSVVLATRSADGIVDNSDDRVQTVVGISQAADGVYVCEVENFPHRTKSGISRTVLNIQTKSRKLNSVFESW